jgi:hypothetical protein
VEVVTTGDGVHRRGLGGAPRGAVWCHRRFLDESWGSWPSHRREHRRPEDGAPPLFFQRLGSSGAGRVVTATPRAVPPPSLSSDQRCWNSTIGRGTAMSGAHAKTSSFAPMALFGLGAGC